MNTSTHTRDRGLLAAATVIAVLVVIATFSVLTRAEPEVLPADTPEGTVQRYVEAVLSRDDTSAYAESSEFWCEYGGRSDGREIRVVLTSTEIDGDEAVVAVSLTESYGDGPFGVSEYEQDAEFLLIDRDGRWVIVDGPWELAPRCEETS